MTATSIENGALPETQWRAVMIQRSERSDPVHRLVAPLASVTLSCATEGS